MKGHTHLHHTSESYSDANSNILKLSVQYEQSATLNCQLYKIKNITSVPFSLRHVHTVEGHDLLPAVCDMIDPLRCFRCPGDDTVHVTADVPGDDPRSSIILHKGQVANLHSKMKG